MKVREDGSKARPYDFRPGTVILCGTGRPKEVGRGPTEAEALAAALEKAS